MRPLGLVRGAAFVRELMDTGEGESRDGGDLAQAHGLTCLAEFGSEAVTQGRSLRV